MGAARSRSMERLGFSPRVFATAIGADLILFDSKRDRYLALPGALTDVIGSGVDVSLAGAALLPKAADVLVGAGLMGANEPGRGVVAIARPTRMLPIVGGRSAVGMSDVARVTAAVVQTDLRLRRGLPCRQFSRSRSRAPRAPGTGLADAVYRLREARLLVPHPRRCLPASVAAATFLTGLDHHVEIVFGVRSHPFEAHCWVESDGVLLDDDLDRVRAYAPIAVGQL